MTLLSSTTIQLQHHLHHRRRHVVLLPPRSHCHLSVSYSSPPPPPPPSTAAATTSTTPSLLKLFDSSDIRRRRRRRRSRTTTNATRTATSSRCSSRYLHPSPIASSMDDDSITFPHILSSSEGEESDTELLISGLTVVDVDLPTSRDKLDAPESAFTLTPHSIINMPQGHKKRGILSGVFINLVLVIFLYTFLLLVDWWAWRIVRQPLQPFYLTLPFSISSVLSACAGYLYVPLLRTMKFYQMLRKEGPSLHSLKKGTPTMGGLFFIPIGIIVARILVGLSSIEVYGAAVVTLALAAIGMLDDILSFVKNNNYGLPGFIKFLLQVAVGIWFCFWLVSTKISSPYSMKFLVPLPSPFGLVYFGKFYLLFTAFCLVSMGNGVNLTDGLDGLAGGTVALALSGMSVAVLPICPDLAVFGASMAGACMGFLCHNRYKASIFMGDTGSLALGGSLAAMAGCTGLFLPLFVCSGVFFLEALSVTTQVFYFMIAKYVSGSGRRLFRMAPFHHHLELCGLEEPVIVASTYILSCILSLSAAYIGFMSV